ncbi:MULTISPECIES: DUF2887 domain-containing protein, partial [unclassified Limnospira]|uniref:DUF2887 domain-containing protein n=1 Tax=unclassified Limnospira TaxID=2642885 RepID=UPI0037BE2AFC
MKFNSVPAPSQKMKTDKLFYRIFLWQPELIAELVPGIPTDCQFDYSAPVVK